MGCLQNWINATKRDMSAFGNPIILLPLYLLIVGLEHIRIIIPVWILVELIGAVIKLIYPKDRPKKRTGKSFIGRIEAQSFPSVHSMRASSFALVFYTLTLNSLMSAILLIMMCVGVGLSRVYRERHDWYDVIGGWLLGGIIAYSYLYYIL